MERNLAALAAREFDVVVIGGGAYGACTAWEAASRGLSVALVEKSDFCSATSANHLKMVHGGIRYLQHLDFARVRQSCAERTALLTIAPHLVRPIPIVMPTYGRGVEGKLVLRAGLHLYDTLTLDKNRPVRDPGNRVPVGRIIGRDRVCELVPGIDRKGLSGGGLFYDGQFVNPPRLALAFLRSAVEAGAEVANYIRAEDFLERDGKVTGIVASDVMTGDRLDIRGRVVINAAGPWAHELVSDKRFDSTVRTPAFSRDAGFIVKGRPFEEVAVACKIASKDPDAVLSRNGRHIFLVPWRDYTLVGVWHVVHKRGPDITSVSEEELQEFIAEINDSMPSLELRREKVSMVCSGLTLFGDNKVAKGDLRFGHRSILMDHKKLDGRSGLITMVGVRATTARALAESAIDMAFGKLDKKPVASCSRSIPVFGGGFDSLKSLLTEVRSECDGLIDSGLAESISRNYGSDYKSVTSLMRNENASAEIAGSGTIIAQVLHAIREEMAVTLCDVIFRRTDAGSAGYPGAAAVTQICSIMASELGWDDRRAAAEIEQANTAFRSVLALEA